MRRALWDRAGPLPEEESERLLCELYHCLPSALNEEDEWTLSVFAHLHNLRYQLEHPSGTPG